jgi:hypothetical protein
MHWFIDGRCLSGSSGEIWCKRLAPAVKRTAASRRDCKRSRSHSHWGRGRWEGQPMQWKYNVAIQLPILEKMNYVTRMITTWADSKVWNWSNLATYTRTCRTALWRDVTWRESRYMDEISSTLDNGVTACYEQNESSRYPQCHLWHEHDDEAWQMRHARGDTRTCTHCTSYNVNY